jgi:hypothetical protein
MIRQLTALRVLTELNLHEVFFPNEPVAEREEHSKRIIKYLAFRAGRTDSQSWIGLMDGEKTVPDILGDILWMFNWDRPYEPFQSGPYDRVFTDMALIEGATALDLTSHAKRSYAVMTYLRGVKSTIELFKKQYDVRKEDEARLQIPSLAPVDLVTVDPVPVDEPALESDDEQTSLVPSL